MRRLLRPVDTEMTTPALYALAGPNVLGVLADWLVVKLAARASMR